MLRLVCLGEGQGHGYRWQHLSECPSSKWGNVKTDSYFAEVVKVKLGLNWQTLSLLVQMDH